MKKLCFLAVVLNLLGSGVFAVTIGNWVGPTGSFADNSKWDGSQGPSTWTSTSTGDEVKICVENAQCILDSAVTTAAAYRYSVAMGPNGATLQIVNGGSLDFGETRIGAQGATSSYSIGRVNQTGGNVTFSDLLLGRGGSSGNPDIQGYYTISGGTIGYTTNNGRLYVGCGNSTTSPAYTIGKFTVVGNDPNILFRALWVGGNTTTYGTGTVEFRVDPDGVSPIKLDGACNLDVYTADPTLSKAYLVVSATGATTPEADIVLVQQNGTAAVIGRFDTLNGGSAAEGTQVIVGDNVYKLTYFYAANDATQNDIALKHVANFNDLAHAPNPVNGHTEETSLSSLSWTNPEPNEPGGVITCDVYFGKDPNRPQMDKKTLGADVSTVAVNSANFPRFVPLTDKTWYYWVVDVHDTTNPGLVGGVMWSFYTDNNTAPVVDAGVNQVAWLGKSGTPGREVISLDGTVTDDGLPTPPAITYLWERIAGPATAVISPTNTVDTSVTVTERGTYEFMLTASDGDKQNSDTVQIIVGTNTCDASHMSTGNPYDAGDKNQDCIVNLEDLAALISANWLDCTDTRTNCGN